MRQGSGHKVAASGLAALVGLSGCATPPTMHGPPAPSGEAIQTIRIATHSEQHIEERLSPSGGFGGIGATVQTRPLVGASCFVRNDRGAWEVITPGSVDVPIGVGNLTVECRLPGYQSAKMELPCMTPQARASAVGASLAALMISSSGPALAFAVPSVGPALAVVAGTIALGAVVGYGVGQVAGPGSEVCNYLTREGYLELWLKRTCPDRASCPDEPPASAASTESPRAAVEVRQSLRLWTHRWVGGTDTFETPHLMGFGSEYLFGKGPGEGRRQELRGAKCAVRSGRGSWETTTPGEIELLADGGNVTVECSLPGFQVARMEVSCITPGGRATGSCSYFPPSGFVDLRMKAE